MTSASDNTPLQPRNNHTAALERLRFAVEGHRQAKTLHTDHSKREILEWLEAAAVRSHWT